MAKSNDYVDMLNPVSNEERIFREKFLAQLKTCGCKIFDAQFRVACAMCCGGIQKKEISFENFYSELKVIVCKICAKRINAPTSDNCCMWCGKTEHPSLKLIPCRNCQQKICEGCVKKVKKTAIESGRCKDDSWICIFCDVRPLWTDRAICNALSVEIPSLIRSNRKEVANVGNDELFTAVDCVICMNSEASVAFIPCGHVCLCDTCLPSYKIGFAKCPLCMSQYQDTLKVFF